MDYLWNNPDKAKTMGDNAFDRFNEHFTMDKMAQDYFKIYQKLL